MVRWVLLFFSVVTLVSWQVGCKLYEPPGFGARDGGGGSSESVASTEASSDGGGSNVVIESVPKDDSADAAVPTTADELFAWLKALKYSNWSRESKPHQTQGPHRSGTLVYINPTLEKSLKAGNVSHPKGAVAVKQLYEADLKTPAGWAVMQKVEDSSQGGRGWYWFEVFVSQNGFRYIADGKGVQLCTGCHAPGKDFILTKYPLQ